MKKQNFPWLVLLTCIFAAFVLGFFSGRNLNRTPVLIQAPSPVAETATPEPAASTESAAEPATENSDAVLSFPININTATSTQLQALPGIGPTYAQRIIDYRSANGPFTSASQLLNISGIGEKRLAAIWDYITIGD